jgi:hypothetical protein
MAKERNGANFVFRHMRLLIGWHVWENNRTEAWLREISSSEAAGDHTIEREIDWYRVHTSSDGSEELGKGIMDVNELHPALFQGSSDPFLHMGRIERLRYLVYRYVAVTSGRWKYCEQEGGVLKVLKPVVVPTAGKGIVGQKRKRSFSSPEASECDTSNKDAYRPCDDEEDDDDEELPKVKDEPTDEALMKQGTAPGPPQGTSVDVGDHDSEEIPLKIKDEPTDEDPVHQDSTVSATTIPELLQAALADTEDDDAKIGVKTEPSDVNAIAQRTAITKAVAPELQQDTSFDVHPHRHVTKGVASMGLKDNVSAHDKHSEDHELHLLDTHASEAPGPESLAASAQTLKDTLLKHISEWAKSASIFKLDLTKPAGELYLAVDVSQIAIASKSILQHVTSYCEDVGNMRAKLQQDLEDAKDKGMPRSLNHAQEDLVRKYIDKEVDLRAVIENMTQQVERLQAELS